LEIIKGGYQMIHDEEIELDEDG